MLHAGFRLYLWKTHHLSHQCRPRLFSGRRSGRIPELTSRPRRAAAHMTATDSRSRGKSVYHLWYGPSAGEGHHPVGRMTPERRSGTEPTWPWSPPWSRFLASASVSGEPSANVMQREGAGGVPGRSVGIDGVFEPAPTDGVVFQATKKESGTRPDSSSVVLKRINT